MSWLQCQSLCWGMCTLIPGCCIGLCEKQAVSYLPVTKSSVLAGFDSLQNHCITKNEHCHSSLGKFLSFVSWKAGTVSYFGQQEEEKHLRLEACICIEKQGALGRELLQEQELGCFCTLSLAAVCPELGYLWWMGTRASHPLLQQDRSLSMQRLWLFWQLYTKFIWK